MTKTLRRITGVCSAVLMMSPMFTSVIQSANPITASAKRRSHRSKGRSKNKKAFKKASSNSKKKGSSDSSLLFSSDPFSSNNFETYNPNIGLQAINYTNSTSKHKKSNKKKKKSSNKSQNTLVNDKNGYVTYTYKEPDHSSAKQVAGMETGNALGEHSHAKASGDYVIQTYKPASQGSVFGNGGGSGYDDAATYNSVVNDPQYNDSTKANLLSLYADPVENGNTSGMISAGTFQPSSAASASTAAGVNDQSDAGFDTTYVNSDNGSSFTDNDMTGSSAADPFWPTQTSEQMSEFGSALGSIASKDTYKSLADSLGTKDTSSIASAQADMLKSAASEYDEDPSVGTSNFDNFIANEDSSWAYQVYGTYDPGDSAAPSAASDDSSSADASDSYTVPASSSSDDTQLYEDLDSAMDSASSAGDSSAEEGAAALTLLLFLADDSTAPSSAASSASTSNASSAASSAASNGSQAANSSTTNSSVAMKTVNPSQLASTSSSASNKGTTSSVASANNFNQVPSAIQSDANSEATDFGNAVQTSPIKSSAKNSLESKFNSDPVKAASDFADSVNDVSAKKVASDKPFQSAMASATATSGNTPSLVYSANTKKGAKSVKSDLTSAESGMTKSQKASVAPIGVTNDKLTAAQSKQLQEDRDAVSGMIGGINAGNHSLTKTNIKTVGNAQSANSTLEQTPEMLNAKSALMSAPVNGKQVLSQNDILDNNQKPNYSNMYMIYEQQKLSNGTLMDHVVSYDGAHDGWINDNAIQAASQPRYAKIPRGSFYFKDPAKDETYELPLDTSYTDPYISKPTKAVGADHVRVTAARKISKGGKMITSYYIKDAAHPYINGWVNSDELAKTEAKGASSKAADTPKATGKNVTQLAINVEGDLSDAPLAMNNDKAGTDTLNLPTNFSSQEVNALHAKKGSDIDWHTLDRTFFNSNKNMSRLTGSATYYRANGHVVYVPQSDVKAELAAGKQLFHFEYKVDKSATKKANANAKNGDVLNVYYKRVVVPGISGAKGKDSKNAKKVVSNKSNQQPSTKSAQKVATPKK